MGGMPAMPPTAQRAIACIYLVGLVLLYLLVALHTPIFLIPTADHDDGLYLSLGQYLAEGKWLGPFNQFTLMKGPGYPAFLALNHWIGTSATLGHALFHCASVLFFVVIAHQFIRSYLLSGLLFALLLWQPASLVIFRVLRDRIYLDQLLILVAALTWSLFGAREDKERAIFACLSGAVLGWFWLTREEGVWILPALALILVAGFLHARRSGHVRAFAVSVVICLTVFAVAQIGYRAANWWAYGKFIGVDFKEANFQRALGAIASVRSGETKPYIPATASTRQLIYRVSPAFASLSPDLEGSIGLGWRETSCVSHPESCGEIGAGWFMWALRAAAAETGQYASPEKASVFFGRMADEIEAACAAGRLKCASHLFPEMPATSGPGLQQRLPRQFRHILGLLLLTKPPLSLPQEAGSKASVASALRFLNDPSPVVVAGAPGLVGWFHRSGAEWFSMVVKRADGSKVDVRIERRDSADVAAHFRDPSASSQRFVMSFDCNERCRIELQTEKGERAEISFGQLAKSPLAVPVGAATFFVEKVGFAAETRPPTALGNAALRLRTAVLVAYPYILIPLVAFGAIAFAVATVLYWKHALWNVCYVVASASWLLVLSRVAILLLIGLTSFPALKLGYMAPAQAMLACAAVLSCAAWYQLTGLRQAKQVASQGEAADFTETEAKLQLRKASGSPGSGESTQEG
jgi:hypothetical protein